MKNFLFFLEDKKHKNLKNCYWLFLIFIFAFSFSFFQIQEVKAQAVVTDPGAMAQRTVESVKQTFWQKLGTALKKAGSIAFNRTLQSSLNKIAYDAANYIGAGGDGQKPLFRTEGLGDYMKKIGDEAGGQFLETFVRNLDTSNATSTLSCEKRLENCLTDCYRQANGYDPADAESLKYFRDGVAAGYVGAGGQDTKGEVIVAGQACVKQCELGNTSCVSNPNNNKLGSASDVNSFNVCQPSSIEVKLKISLGLVEQNRPTGPNCTATTIINNWGDDIDKKLASISDGSFLKNIDNIFDPRANDLGIYFLARTDLSAQSKIEVDKAVLEDTKTGGWIDVRNIAGELKGTPDTAKNAEADARAIRIANFGKTTGDIFVDAANLFLNQLAISAYNNLMRKLSDKKADAGPALADPGVDPNFSSVSSMREKTRVLIETNFESKADYSVLSELAACPNPGNPGPNNCVIDDRFMQAIVEQKTVGEAIKEGYLNSNWKVEKDVFASAYNNHYSLRNIKILRKYRIVPLAWEVAIEKAFEDEEIPENVTLGDLVACFSENDEFDKFSTNFKSSDISWCQGLVDPNWVLKAPLNYCGQSGSGSHILNMTMIPSLSSSEQLIITRADDYCADNQSCIKESKEGACDLYGYCTEDRRTWNFESDSCSPINNTCQSFINTSNQATASYLENTLDYGDCNADSAGCRRYSLFGKYNENGSVSWNLFNNLFFNKNLVSCNSENEGCSELMRIKPTWGFNFVTDSAFNFFGLNQEPAGSKLGPWGVLAGANAQIINTNEEAPDFTGNSKAIKISGSNGAGFESSSEVFPENLQILINQDYTLSADIFLFSGDRVQMFLNPGDKQVSTVVNQSGYWQRVSLTINTDSGFYEPKFSFVGYGSSVSFYVKNIKFELSGVETTYNNYGSYISRAGSLLSARFSQKLLPAYLHETCYVDSVSASKDYTLKSDAPAICSNYARQCNQDEVGCELFINSYDNFSTPAQVNSSDYCAGECVGYDVYIAKENYFNPTEAQNLIPNSTTKCAQSAVGCNEFTNLDAVAKGGEGKEYYSELKQCIKPNSGQCANFYTWESSAGGYQIKTYSLQKDNNNNPLINYGDQASGDCSDIFGLPLSDPRYNPDCREFRNTSGQVSYRLISRVITCSDNCFSYRLNSNNIHPTAKTQAECNSSSDETYWNSSNSTCLTCLNGGKWDTNQNACVYQAIPGEGKSCQASQVGCREYNGNRGNDVRLIANYDFENGLSGWYSNCTDGVDWSPVANNQQGSSLFYNSSASSCESSGGEKVAKIKLGLEIKAGRAYSLKFLARSAEANILEIYFESVDGDRYFFNLSAVAERDGAVSIKGGNEWAIYQVNLENVTETLGFDGTLNISASHDFYIDDLLLTEISNRYYFIKDSIKIPDVCYYDNSGKYQGADYNLGCSQYKDKDNYIHNLHNFTKLCPSSSIGCEQMITTNNYTSPQAMSWNVNNLGQSCDPGDEGCLTVERDKIIYVVYDKSKSCLANDIGCSRMGEGLGSGYDISWSDVFKLNNPNNYNQTLCAEGDLGCEEYRDINSGGLSYFRNPANNLCVYRSSSNPEISGKAWYKVPVKRCDLNSNGSIEGLEVGGTICSKDEDCVSGTCVVDNNDYTCSVSYLKTIGYGGLGAAIPVPDKSVALCDAAAAGCTEYIDPVSKFNPNLVKNPEYNDGGKGWGEDIWPQVNGNPIGKTEQVISLERNKLYGFRATDKSGGVVDGGVSLKFIGDVRILGEETIDTIKKLGTSNNFGDVTKLLTINANYPYIIFNSLSNYSALLSGGDASYIIELKELAIDYNIRGDVDGSSCNGLVNFDTGCILFNERSIAGAAGLELNKFNALAGDGVPVISYSPYNANKLLKVRPDRTCASWLSCTSYALNSDGSKSCSSVAECNLLDDKNECLNFIVRPEAESIVFDAEKNRNATGYALAGNYYFNNIKEVGLNTSVRYDFEENIPPLSCVRANSAGEPLINDTGFCSFDENIIKDSLIREPGLISYPAKGKTYLKVSPLQAISPHAGGSYVVLPEAGEYYLSYLLNTQNSNTSAKVSIENVSNRNIMHDMGVEEQAPNGWERKIHKITTVKDNVKIRIYLSLVETGSSGPVYFDDINIETVLRVAENDYRARDCRLYPNSSSFGCQEVENSVVRNGVEGYCLEYDLANSSVCQLWMPIDRIASSKINSNQLGYNGKYPLSYCALANSNFLYLEKREAAVVKEESIRRNSDDYLDVRVCYYPGTALNYCQSMFYASSSIEIMPTSTPLGQPISTSGEYNVTITYDNNNPDSEPIITVGGQQDLTQEEQEELPENLVIVGGKVKDLGNIPVVSEYCGDSGNYFLMVTQDLKQENGLFKRDDVAITYLCLPINNYNYYTPDRTFRYVATKSEPITTFSGVQKVYPITDGWYLADGFHNAAGIAPENKRGGSPGGFDELYNADPPLRVLDLNYSIPAGEDDLKKISSSDPDEVFRLTCDKFVEAVSGSGDNMAWTSRVALGSNYIVTSTNPIIRYNGYIRQIGDIPFGAASWPDDFNLAKSERVPLYNQYSAKNKEDVFAGRPYGCNAKDAQGVANCSSIGYCSANPDVYCLVDNTGLFNANTYDITRHSCGTWGTCKPLWTIPTGAYQSSVLISYLKDYPSALSQLFIQAPVAYEFKDDAGGYVSATGYYNSNMAGSNPGVSNLKLYKADTSIEFNADSGIRAGNYRLEFNSNIDSDHQPLKEIFIDWGDGFKQVIIGEDSKSSSSEARHIFYHFYPDNRALDSTIIRVRVYDNWKKGSTDAILTR